jgi:triacylglycerol lipase
MLFSSAVTTTVCTLVGNGGGSGAALTGSGTNGARFSARGAEKRAAGRSSRKARNGRAPFGRSPGARFARGLLTRRLIAMQLPKLLRWVTQNPAIVTAKSLQIPRRIGHDRQNRQKLRGASAMALSKSALAVVAAMAASTASAQQSPMPEDTAWALLEIGRVVDSAKTASLYAPLQEKEPYQGVKVERDVKYGAAERNLLDVFTPEAASAARPVLIFVHGGAFTGGSKRMPGSPFYDNIMLWAVKNGFVGVNMTYRLAPQSPWPAGAEDIGSAVQWISENIKSRGGDPARVYLMGHSAGAVHVADYVSHPQFHKVTGGGLAGAIMVSGIYQLSAESVSDPERAYFGTDPAVYPERSAVQGLLATRIPLMITSAELDPPPFVAQFDMLKASLCKRASGCAHSFMLPQHSHMSEVYSINTSDTRLTGEILDFVKTGK